MTATRMGYVAVKALAEGKTNRVVVRYFGEIKDVDMVEALKQENRLDEEEKQVLGEQ